MIRPVLITLILLSGLSHALAGEAVFDRVMKRKAIDCGYIVSPPYVAKDPNTGRMSGVNVEMMEAIGRNLGLAIRWSTEIGAGDVAAALAAGKFDVMCQTLWPSAGRMTGLTFANRPQFYSAIYAVARADDKRFDGDLSKANVRGVNVTGIEGDFSIDLAAEKLPNATLVPLPTSVGLAEYIMQLTTKKADILFMDKGTVNDFSKDNPHQVKIIPGIGPVRIYGEHVAVKPGEYRLRDMLDMATLQLVNDGVFADIVKRYAAEHGTDIYPSRTDIGR